MIIGARAAALILVGAGAVLLVPGNATSQTETPKVDRPQNRVIFTTTPPGQSPQGAEMRRRLADPVEREKLRAETRSGMRAGHPDMAEVVGIDAATEEKLIELLTDEQMAHLERFWAERSPLDAAAGKPPTAGQDFIRDHNAAENRSKQQIRELLGEEAFYRYLDYKETVPQRQQLVYFEKRLDAADKLTPEQKDQLMAVLRAQLSESIARRRDHINKVRLPAGVFPFSAEAQQKETIALNEEGFRELQRDSRVLLEKIQPVLTPKQHEVYTQMEAEKVASQRRWVQQLRADAGMTPEFDETRPPPQVEKRTPVKGRVRLEVRFQVDEHEPVTADLVTENGKAAAGFKAPEGLWVEATPTLYKDDWASVSLRIYEDRKGKRRLLTDGFNVGMLMRLPDGMPNAGLPGSPLLGGGGTSSVNGSKAFTVSLNARVSPAAE
jgi:hypothetical protein